MRATNRTLRAHIAGKNIMIEPRQEDIERNARSFHALYGMEGCDIYRFIDAIAESMAYQQALVRDYREREREQIHEDRRKQRATKRT